MAGLTIPMAMCGCIGSQCKYLHRQPQAWDCLGRAIAGIKLHPAWAKGSLLGPGVFQPGRPDASQTQGDLKCKGHIHGVQGLGPFGLHNPSLPACPSTEHAKHDSTERSLCMVFSDGVSLSHTHPLK